jgi:hypothetical protein
MMANGIMMIHNGTSTTPIVMRMCEWQRRVWCAFVCALPIPVLPSVEEAVAKGMVIIIPKPTNSHFKKSWNIVGTIIGGVGIPAR